MHCITARQPLQRLVIDCIARYLEEKYVKKKLLESRWTELLDHYRELRHNSQYDVSFITSKDEAKAALDTTRGFVRRMKELIKRKESMN